MSSGSGLYQQQQPEQQQHPLLAAISGNNYAYGAKLGQPQVQSARRAHFPHYMGNPRFVHSFGVRPLATADTNLNGVYTSSSGSSGHSGYGSMGYADEYEDHHPPSPHSASGDNYAYHAVTATGYGAPPSVSHHYAHTPHIVSHSSKGISASSDKKKNSKSATMTALTLLSFFFFVNLLQSCIKDHMDAMNPTVMVLTANSVRNRFNKLAEMNSREQTTSPASSTTSGGWSNAELAPVVATAVPAVLLPVPTVTLQSASYGSSSSNSISAHKPHQQQQEHQLGNYGNSVASSLGEMTGGNNNYYQHQHQHQHQQQQQQQYQHSNSNKHNNYVQGTTFSHTNSEPYYHESYEHARPNPNPYSQSYSHFHYPSHSESYSDTDSDLYADSSSVAYRNRTLLSATSTDKRYPNKQQQQQQQQQSHYASPHSYPWSYGTSTTTHKRYSANASPWSSASFAAHSSISSYLDDTAG